MYLQVPQQNSGIKWNSNQSNAFKINNKETENDISATKNRDTYYLARGSLE